MKKKYFTEEEKKAAQREADRRWKEAHPEYYQDNKEKIDEKNNQWKQNHKEEWTEYQKQYKKTPRYRAHNLLNTYRRNDKDAGRGECTLTAEWIIDNIFTQKCHWCPETDWTKIGCDRIDNSLPHTPDNVIPCCYRCNSRRGKMTYEEFEKALRAKETTL